MSKAWTDIPLAERDVESPGTEALITKFHDNQESVISIPMPVRYDEVQGSTGTLVTVEQFVPPAVATTGAVTFKIRFEGKVSAGGTIGRVRMQLGAGTIVETGDISSTTYAFFTLTISDANVKAVADTVANLAVLVSRSAGAGNIVTRCLGGASRLERAA